VWNRCAFTVAKRDYLWRDVMLAAMWRGAWAPFEARLRHGLACEAHSYESDDPADQDVVDAATAAFRYANELITAEETERWLERMGLSIETWSAYFARQDLLARWGNDLDAIMDAHAPDDDLVREHLVAEGICSGRFREMGVALAGLAAVAAGREDAGGVLVSQPGPAALQALRTSHGFLLEDIPDDDLGERLAGVARLEAVFAATRDAAITHDALQAQIESSRLDWMVVDMERLSFPEESMVRETLLCCREDGLTLGQLAQRIRRRVHTEELRLEDSPPDLRPLLLSAPPGELLGPIAADDAFHAIVVRGKRLPSADDPEVRQLAERAVVDAVLHRARVLHVHWQNWV